jgi:hypothetical protein
MLRGLLRGMLRMLRGLLRGRLRGMRGMLKINVKQPSSLATY